MKICSKCKMELYLHQFHKSNQSKDGLQPICRNCKKSHDRGRQLNGSKSEQKRIKTIHNTVWVHKIKSENGCKYCRERDYIVLDFHHRNPKEKKSCVSSILDRDRNTIQKEIDKCDIVCANCHRRIHAGTIKPDECAGTHDSLRTN